MKSFWTQISKEIRPQSGEKNAEFGRTPAITSWYGQNIPIICGKNRISEVFIHLFCP